ncbi:MAG: GNAT family N-acetyltransferase [Rhizobiaceae bacterium]|nr:GNAT family N-acetyltransferase [Rhizobiaceae bacterium]
MDEQGFRVRVATADDISSIMATERRDGFERLVGRWDEATHRAAFAQPGFRYFVGESAGRRFLGFALVRDWASPDRVTGIKRLAVCEPGQGHGRRMLRHVIDAVFRQTEAYRLWIGTFPENERARRAYRGAGFVEEGVARGNAFFAGASRDELMLSILRPEWLARQAL